MKPLESQGADLFGLDQVLDLSDHPQRSQDLIARSLAAEARGEVCHRADGAVIPTPLKTNSADCGIPLGNPNPQGEVVTPSAPLGAQLLYTLALEQGRVVTRDELLQRIWGRRQTHRDRTVDVFVRRLRDKIDKRAPRHTFIQTRYGVGYKLDPQLK